MKPATPTAEDEVARGIRAAQIIEDPMFKEAVQKVQQKVFDEFAATDPKEKDLLQMHRLQLKALADVVRQLQSVIQTGQFAKAKIEQGLKERLKAGVRRVF